jgi:hypothetical protein
MDGVLLNRDKPQAGTTVPRPIADIAEISGHRGAMYANGTGVGADALAFIQGDHQERSHIGKGYGAAQIGQRLERPQEGLDDPLVALPYRSLRGQI